MFSYSSKSGLNTEHLIINKNLYVFISVTQFGFLSI